MQTDYLTKQDRSTTQVILEVPGTDLRRAKIFVNGDTEEETLALHEEFEKLLGVQR